MSSRRTPVCAEHSLHIIDLLLIHVPPSNPSPCLLIIRVLTDLLTVFADYWRMARQGMVAQCSSHAGPEARRASSHRQTVSAPSISTNLLAGHSVGCYWEACLGTINIGDELVVTARIFHLSHQAVTLHCCHVLCAIGHYGVTHGERPAGKPAWAFLAGRRSVHGCRMQISM